MKNPATKLLTIYDFFCRRQLPMPPFTRQKTK
jgi:hypothetical protein